MCGIVIAESYMLPTHDVPRLTRTETDSSHGYLGLAVNPHNTAWATVIYIF